MPEKELVRDLVALITGVSFRVERPQENRLRLRQQAEWLVWGSSIKHAFSVRALTGAWKDRGGSLWLETSKIDDMTSLVERKYSEEGVRDLPDTTRGIAPTGKIPDEVVRFPKVVDILKECERKVAEVSTTTGVHLEILYDGGAGLTTFRIGARIDSPTSDAETLRRQITEAAEALKQAYNQVRKVVWG